MQIINEDANILENIGGKTAIITGAANGIGAQTAVLLNSHGANAVIADLESTRAVAESLISSMHSPSNAMFVPTNVVDWDQMKSLFKQAVARFGKVEVVIANAGVMESKPALEIESTDEDGDLLESKEAFRVIDINLKGAFNTLRLALFTMQSNLPNFSDYGCRGSVVLIASTSGYFGGTGVAAYVASKHGIVGLLRASQGEAQRLGIRVNAVAPFFTPTRITAGFSQAWQDAGLESNTVERVAFIISQMALDRDRHGSCALVS
ncbi:putative short chain dehydrogenase/reductase [Xylariales sp. PMI_506]|nr:putative short chain dehydrogenase/reductase [Xylariales sp. PMI_506]